MNIVANVALALVIFGCVGVIQSDDWSGWKPLAIVVLISCVILMIASLVTMIVAGNDNDKATSNSYKRIDGPHTADENDASDAWSQLTIQRTAYHDDSH